MTSRPTCGSRASSARPICSSASMVERREPDRAACGSTGIERALGCRVPARLRSRTRAARCRSGPKAIALAAGRRGAAGAARGASSAPRSISATSRSYQVALGHGGKTVEVQQTDATASNVGDEVSARRSIPSAAISSPRRAAGREPRPDARRASSARSRCRRSARDRAAAGARARLRRLGDPASIIMAVAAAILLLPRALSGVLAVLRQLLLWRAGLVAAVLASSGNCRGSHAPSTTRCGSSPARYRCRSCSRCRWCGSPRAPTRRSRA